MGSRKEAPENDRRTWVDEFLDSPDLWDQNDLNAPYMLQNVQPPILLSNGPRRHGSHSQEPGIAGNPVYYSNAEQVQAHSSLAYEGSGFVSSAEAARNLIPQNHDGQFWYPAGSAPPQSLQSQHERPCYQVHNPVFRDHQSLSNTRAQQVLSQSHDFNHGSRVSSGLLSLDTHNQTTQLSVEIPTRSSSIVAERWSSSTGDVTPDQTHFATLKRRRKSPSPALGLTPEVNLYTSMQPQCEPKAQASSERPNGKKARRTLQATSRDANLTSRIVPRHLASTPFPVPDQTKPGDFTPFHPKQGRAAAHEELTRASRSKRTGPLSIAQREKIEEMRFHGACWRCRRYKKPCNNGAGVCDTCLTSGLRVWPSTLGCRRGDLDEFVIVILPSNLEDIVKSTHSGTWEKPPNWRLAISNNYQNTELRLNSPIHDKWYHLSKKILATGVLGIEFVELVEIMAEYERNSNEKNTHLQFTANTISYTCDFYFYFVATYPPIEPPDIFATINKLRTCYSRSWSAILAACLKGRMRDWVTSFLSACIETCVLSVFVDAICAMRPEARALLWPSTENLVMELRHRLHATVQDLLSALAKGAKPLSFKCWTWEEEDDPVGGGNHYTRHKEGMRIMGGDAAAFDAMVKLKGWVQRYRPLLDTDIFFESAPFTVGATPISYLARFVKAAQGEFEDAGISPSSSTRSHSIQEL